MAGYQEETYDRFRQTNGREDDPAQPNLYRTHRNRI